MNSGTARFESIFSLFAKALVGLCLFVGCSKHLDATATAKLDGSVFLVTRGAQNLKLGLVSITAFPADQFTSFSRRAEQLVISENQELYSRSAELLKLLDRENEAATQAIQKSDKKGSDSHALLDTAQQHLDSGAKYGEEIRNLNRKLGLKLFEAYSKIMPTNLLRAKTDADGKFSMEVPATNRYVIFAQAQIDTLPGQAAQFIWAVQLPLHAQTNQILLLSNHNLAGGGHPDSVLEHSFLEQKRAQATSSMSSVGR